MASYKVVKLPGDMLVLLPEGTSASSGSASSPLVLPQGTLFAKEKTQNVLPASVALNMLNGGVTQAATQLGEPSTFGLENNQLQGTPRSPVLRTSDLAKAQAKLSKPPPLIFVESESTNLTGVEAKPVASSDDQLYTCVDKSISHHISQITEQADITKTLSNITSSTPMTIAVPRDSLEDQSSYRTNLTLQPHGDVPATMSGITVLPNVANSSVHSAACLPYSQKIVPTTVMTAQQQYIFSNSNVDENISSVFSDSPLSVKDSTQPNAIHTIDNTPPVEHPRQSTSAGRGKLTSPEKNVGQKRRKYSHIQIEDTDIDIPGGIAKKKSGRNGASKYDCGLPNVAQKPILIAPSPLPTVPRLSVPMIENSVLTRSILQPTHTGVHTIMQPTHTGVQSIIQPTNTGVQSIIQPTHTGVQSIIQPTNTGVQSIIQPTNTVVQSIIQPANTVVQSIIQPTNTGVHTIMQPTHTGVQSIIQATHTGVTTRPLHHQAVNNSATMVQPKPYIVLPNMPELHILPCDVTEHAEVQHKMNKSNVCNIVNKPEEPVNVFADIQSISDTGDLEVNIKREEGAQHTQEPYPVAIIHHPYRPNNKSNITSTASADTVNTEHMDPQFVPTFAESEDLSPAVSIKEELSDQSAMDSFDSTVFSELPKREDLVTSEKESDSGSLVISSVVSLSDIKTDIDDSDGTHVQPAHADNSIDVDAIPDDRKQSLNGDVNCPVLNQQKSEPTQMEHSTEPVIPATLGDSRIVLPHPLSQTVGFVISQTPTNQSQKTMPTLLSYRGRGTGLPGGSTKVQHGRGRGLNYILSPQSLSSFQGSVPRGACTCRPRGGSRGAISSSHTYRSEGIVVEPKYMTNVGNCEPDANTNMLGHKVDTPADTTSTLYSTPGPMRVRGAKLPAYVCKECGLYFTDEDKKNQHELSHTGKRAYVCTYCQARFSTPSNRAQHEWMHTGKRLYPCQHCGLRFGSKSACTTHEPMHDPVTGFVSRNPVLFEIIGSESNVKKKKVPTATLR